MADLMRDTILAMEAGPKFNALIATEVMGWVKVSDELQVWEWCDPAEDNEFIMDCNWSPSTDMEWAWPVVEKLDEKWIFDLRRNRVAGKVQIEVSFWRWKRGTLSESYKSIAPTAPLAICRAALLTTLKVKATSDA